MPLVDVESEVTGKVWRVETKEGDRVEAGELIMILESMKMEIPVESEVTGTVVKICVTKDESVDEDQVLAVIDT